jgi:hypothetical protein
MVNDLDKVPLHVSLKLFRRQRDLHTAGVDVTGKGDSREPEPAKNNELR